MTEKDAVNKLILVTKAELPGAVVFKLADQWTMGIPDLAVVWGGNTWWFEVKVRRGKLIDREVQRLTMRRLFAAGGRALYVVFDEVKHQTYLVRPDDIGLIDRDDWGGGPDPRIDMCEGRNYRAIVLAVAAEVLGD